MPAKQSGGRARGIEIKEFVLANAAQHPNDLPATVAKRFGISRQAAHKHIRKLVSVGALSARGNTRHHSYEIPERQWSRRYSLPALAEHQVWYEDVKPLMKDLAHNVLEIWEFCFTEMLNNAIDHSGGTDVLVTLTENGGVTRISLIDDGIGIFRKIKESLDLPDERHSVLELAKGKFTTDPANHTGQGIFFTSRVLDNFAILSGDVYFSHAFTKEEDWILGDGVALRGEGGGTGAAKVSGSGTNVVMVLDDHTTRTCEEVFTKFSSQGDCRFTKTTVPVRLMQYGQERLVSRSQAKILLSRLERFEVVIFDFSGVESIGQAFADQVFRVFAASHPHIEILAINKNESIERSIAAVRAEPSPVSWR